MYKTQNKLHLQVHRQAFDLKHSVEIDDVQLLCDTERNL